MRLFCAVACGLFLIGCASTGPTYDQQSSTLPALSPETGRIVFFGTNWAWYGVLAGISWNPEITINGKVEPTPNGTSIFFNIDLPPGTYELAVVDQDTPAHTVELSKGEVHFLEMLRLEVREDKILTLRTTKSILTFSSVPAGYANQTIRKMKYEPMVP